jgi:hypothetical protein
MNVGWITQEYPRLRPYQVHRDELKALKDAGNDNVLEKAKYILLKRHKTPLKLYVIMLSELNNFK